MDTILIILLIIALVVATYYYGEYSYMCKEMDNLREQYRKQSETIKLLNFKVKGNE